MAICRTQIYCSFGPLLFNCNLAVQILKNSSNLNIKQKHGNPMQKLKISSMLNIEQMHGNTATPFHLQLLPVFYRHICPNWNSNIKKCISLLWKNNRLYGIPILTIIHVSFRKSRWKQLKLSSEASVIKKNSLTT